MASALMIVDDSLLREASNADVRALVMKLKETIAQELAQGLALRDALHLTTAGPDGGP